MANTFIPAYLVEDQATGAFYGVCSSDGKTITLGASTLSAVSYNGSSQVTGYTLNSVAYTVAYPNSTTITVVGGGVTKTITMDGSGRITGLAIS